jgi:hypothetical protein
VRGLPAPRHLRFFLASPGDVLEERRAVRELVEHLEREPLVRGRFTLEVVSWDDPDAPAPMLATLDPQEAVRRALPLPSDCDVTIVVLWRRMGTPLATLKADGSPYLSGTEWEFDDAFRVDKPILLYRRTAGEPTSEAADTEASRQERLVEAFFDRFKGPAGTLSGAYTTYATVDEFSRRLRKDVESLLGRFAVPATREAETWAGRIRTWHPGRLALVWAGGAVATFVSAVALANMPGENVPALGYAIKYILTALTVGLPLLLVGVTWIWLDSPNRDPLP